jgi:uncharacterized protein with HEPN domain
MTSKKAGRLSDYVEHIISAIDQIQKYAQGLDQNTFIASDMAQDAIIRQFEVIGEAARRIISTDPEFTKKYPVLQLEAAYRMRNALAHGYDTVNLWTVWDTIEQNLPHLKDEAIRVLKIEFAPE